jgi:hypothetical protein
MFYEHERYIVSKVSFRGPLHFRIFLCQLDSALFDRSRAEFAVTHVAVERFLTTDKNEKRLAYRLIRFFFRWFLMFIFVVTVAFSALYMLGRVGRMSLNANAFVLVFLGYLAALLLFILLSASLVVLQIILHLCTAQSQAKSKFCQILQWINDRIIVRGIASALFGIDTTDSEGGEVIHLTMRMLYANPTAK